MIAVLGQSNVPIPYVFFSMKFKRVRSRSAILATDPTNKSSY